MGKDVKRMSLCIQKKILQLTKVFLAVFILTVLFGVSNCSEAWAREIWIHHDACWPQNYKEEDKLHCKTCGAAFGNGIEQIRNTQFYCGDTLRILSGKSTSFLHGLIMYKLPDVNPYAYSKARYKGTKYLDHAQGQAAKLGPMDTTWSGTWVLYNKFSDSDNYGGADWKGTITVLHAWSGWTRTANPTCTAQGSEYRTCTGCGEREVRAVAALGHAWSAKTDRGDGYSDQRCSRCGAITNRTANTYYVAYNGNGTTGGSTANSTHTYDAAKALTANGFTRTGYLFNGWTTNANGSGTKYNNQQSVINLAKNNGATVHLYAQWTPVNYTVVYNGNGNAGGSTASSSHTYNVAKNLTKNGFTPKAGYHFSGWTTNANGSGTKYSDQQSVVNLTTANGGKVNLYAKWELNPFTVKFDGNGADSGTMNDQAFIYGNKQGLNKNQFAREYYEFLGWSTDKNATEPTVLDGADGSTLITVNGGTVILYAVWKLSTVDITFHDQGGTGGPGKVTWLIGSEQIPTIPTKEDNSFLEWNSKPDGTGVPWPKDNLVPTGYPDFYALWMPEVYTAVYEPNEGINPGHSYRTATLLPGPEINRIFKDLAGTPENIFYIREAPRCIAAGSYSIAENGAVRAYFRGNTIFIYSDAMQIQMNPDSAGMLAGLPNLKDIGTVKTWDAIHIKDAKGFFQGDKSLTALDLTAWRTRNVNNMASMFNGCTALAEIKVDKGNWSIENVGDYNKGIDVFKGCVSLNGYDASKTDVTNAVTDGYLTEAEAVLDWDAPVKNVQKIESASETTLNKNTYSRVGYQFAGWALDRDDNTADFRDQEKTSMIKGAADDIIPIYAVWDPNEYTINFDKHDEKAEGAMEPQEFSYDKPQALSPNKFTKAGYHFDHWNLNPDDSGDSFHDQQEVKNLTDERNGKLTMYAFWMANDYTVRFHKNFETATGHMDDQGFSYDKPQKLAPNRYEREGYYLKAWNTAPDLSGTSYANEQEVLNLTDVKNGIVDLYAEWDQNRYTIRFDANGGDGTMADIPMLYDQSTPLTRNIFTRVGYTFDGWNTAPDGTGTSFVDGQNVKNLTDKKDAVVTLYARWIPHTYIIQFAGGGATSGEMENQTMTYDKPQNLPWNQFKRLGYRFTNWRVVIDNKSQYYNDGAEIKNLTSETGRVLTFTAQWEESGYTVRFDKNAEAATGTMKSQLFTIDESQNLTANQFKQPGYVFAGWNTKADGSGTAYADRTSVRNLTSVNGETVILYAQWKPIQYQIVYDKNHPAATGTMAPVKTSYDRTIWIEDCKFILDRQAFIGWNTKPDGSGTEYQPGTRVKNLTEKHDDVITLYAQWENNVYTIVFNKNAKNATGTMPAMEGEYDQRTALPKNQYLYKGHQFVGWNTKADGSGTSYRNGEQILQPITENDTLTLYAQWETIEYQVRFHGGAVDALGSMLPQTFAYDEEAPLKANTFTRNGYMFKGWSTEDRPGAKIVYKDKESVKNLTATHKGYVDLYAQWGTIEYQVHFDGNGSTNGSMEDITVEYDKQESLPKNQYARFGYQFTGWNTKQDGSGGDYGDGAEIMNLTDVPGETVTLYAQWKSSGYEIRFDPNGEHVTGTMKNQELAFGNREKLNKNTYTRIGYTFAGWNLKPDGKGVPYRDGQEVLNLTIESDKEVVLYAQWTPITYKITFDPGAYNAIGTMEPQVITYDQKTPIQKNAWTRKGYLFEGWCTSLDGAGTRYRDQEEILNLSSTQDEEILLYAMWGHSAYYVEFQGNGATSGKMDRQEFIFNTSQKLNPNAFVRSGYQFAGWNTEADGSGKAYYDEESLKTEAETAGQVIVLYAQWTANERTVSYVLNGGDWASGFTPVTSGPYDEELQLPTAGQISREGHVFLGWYDNASLTGTSYTALPANTGNKTLYAGWYDLSGRKNGISKPVKNDYEYSN